MFVLLNACVSKLPLTLLADYSNFLYTSYMPILVCVTTLHEIQQLYKTNVTSIVFLDL